MLNKTKQNMEVHNSLTCDSTLCTADLHNHVFVRGFRSFLRSGIHASFAILDETVFQIEIV